MSFDIRPLSSINRKASALILGETTCPYCKRPDIWVANDCGQDGDMRFHYLVHHFPNNSKIPCEGIEVPLSSF